jgi:hypothetical protein
MISQLSSKARVKQDGIGEDTMHTLWDYHASAHTDEYRVMCKDAIKKSSGKNETKSNACDALDKMTSKTKMMQFVTNYFLKGERRGL